MGSYDGAEICGLVGLLILRKLSSLVKKTDVGLYRDDGLIVARNMRGRSTDKLRKNIINTFKEIGLQIEIETGMYSVNFLDVTLNLKTNNYQPFKKPNDSLLYVHTSSNHSSRDFEAITNFNSRAASEKLFKRIHFHSIKTHLRGSFDE